jgi:hypothetical protein
VKNEESNSPSIVEEFKVESLESLESLVLTNVSSTPSTTSTPSTNWLFPRPLSLVPRPFAFTYVSPK